MFENKVSLISDTVVVTYILTHSFQYNNSTPYEIVLLYCVLTLFAGK